MLTCPVAAEPVLSRDRANHIDWTLRIEMTMSGDLYLAPDEHGNARPKLQSLGIVFPMLERSASHDVHAAALESVLQIGRHVVDDTPTMLTEFQDQTPLAVWETPTLEQPPTLKLEIPMTCYQTIIDEDLARRIDWPTEQFPEHVHWALQPQAFIESDDPFISELVDQWTNGNPRKARPYVLAKYLAARTLELGDLVADPARASRADGDIAAMYHSGFPVQGAAVAAQSRRMNSYDMSCLLTAVYRAAGIPARLVIAYDPTKAEPEHADYTRPANLQSYEWVYEITATGTRLLSFSKGARTVQKPRTMRIDQLPYRTWVEFYLFDERRNDGEWIPVDVGRQKEAGSRAPNIDHRWPYFGNHDELDEALPIAFHIIPPTSTETVSQPAFWGWYPTYVRGFSRQSILIDAIHTPQGASP